MNRRDFLKQFVTLVAVVPFLKFPEPEATIEFYKLWGDENCDPLSDLQAVHDMMMNQTGYHRPKLLLPKKYGRLWDVAKFIDVDIQWV